MTDVRALAVIIPARDERMLIGRCLESVARSMGPIRRSSGVQVTLTLVADGCSDDTVEVASRYDFVSILTTAPVGVGAARQLGSEYALDRLGIGADRVWLAHTDADSRVDRRWLANQLRVARSDAQVRIGAVRPDFRDLSTAQVRAWRLGHRGGAARGHIHGANLGIRASAYLAAGGFRSLPLHEDVELVRVAAANGAVVATDHRPDVTTSARSVSRVRGGYASYLAGGLLAETGRR